MPQYRGNIGNLLQHWVFSEILECCRDRVHQLAFVDACSMPPLATDRRSKNSAKPDKEEQLFNFVRNRLPGDKTPYEQAWHRIVSPPLRNGGYPNSAALLTIYGQGITPCCCAKRISKRSRSSKRGRAELSKIPTALAQRSVRVIGGSHSAWE
jgi:hypothetical protein